MTTAIEATQSRASAVASRARLRQAQSGLCALVLVGLCAFVELGINSSSAYDSVWHSGTGVYRHRAGSVIRWAREGVGRTTIGMDGMVVRKQIAGAGPRVLFIGDSMSEALQVDDDRKFTELTEGRLRAAGESVTTINMAFSGLSPLQAVVDLRSLRRVYRPRVVVLQMSPERFVPARVHHPDFANASYLVNAPDGGIRIETDSQRRVELAWPERLAVRLRVFATAARVFGSINGRVKAEFGKAAHAQADAQDAPRVSGTTGVDDRWFHETAAFVLGEAARESRDAGVRLVVLTIPLVPRIQDGRLLPDLDADPEAAARQRILADICRDLSVPLVDPADALVAHARATGRQPFGFNNSRPGDGHLNEDGHRLVAAALEPVLAAALRSDIRAVQ